MAISLLELRHIIESGFLPLECRCTANASNELTIEIVDPSTGANLVTGGIDAASLDNSRAIAELVAQMRAQLAQTHGTQSKRAGWRA